MLGLGGGALDLGRIALRPPGLGARPGLGQGAPEVLALQLLDVGRRELLDRPEGLVQLVQSASARREHRAAGQHLQLDAHLEHVGGGRHADVPRSRLGEHRAHGVRGARLAAGLVDRSGDDVRRAHLESGSRRRRGSDASSGAHPRPGGVAPRRRDLVTQGEQLRQENDERSTIGVTARVGLRGDVLGHRHETGQLGLLGRELPRLHQLLDEPGRRRLQEPPRDLRSGDLREHAVRHDDAAAAVPVDAGEPVPDQRERQPQVGRSGDGAHAARQEQLHGFGLDGGLAGAVDEVEAVRQVADGGLQAVDRRLDAGQGAARRAEEGEHARTRERLDHLL